jgi:hypothetical protein
VPREAATPDRTVLMARRGNGQGWALIPACQTTPILAALPLVVVLLRKRCEGLAAIAPPNRVKKSRRFIAAPKLTVQVPAIREPFELNELRRQRRHDVAVSPLARIPDRFS